MHGPVSESESADHQSCWGWAMQLTNLGYFNWKMTFTLGFILKRWNLNWLGRQYRHLLQNFYYLLGTGKSYGLRAQHIMRLHNLLYTVEHVTILKNKVCKFPSHKVAHYRESQDIFFDLSHFVKVPFWLQLIKMGIFHSNTNNPIVIRVTWAHYPLKL